jgi:rare lipoprotein A (peptidoglycan hydrolase)
MSQTLAKRTLLWALVLATALMCAGTLACASMAAAGTAGGAAAPGAAPAPAKTSAKAQIATWFGPGFYGQKTACGQTMSPVIVGVANRTLPCGALVLVNYKGHRLTVPVIDRGPYANGATWDLTSGAASVLTITETVRVKTKVVGQAANNPLLGMPAEVKPTAEAVASGGTAAA